MIYDTKPANACLHLWSKSPLFRKGSAVCLRGQRFTHLPIKVTAFCEKLTHLLKNGFEWQLSALKSIAAITNSWFWFFQDKLMGKDPFPIQISTFSAYGLKGQIDGCMLCFDNYKVLQWRFWGGAAVPGKNLVHYFNVALIMPQEMVYSIYYRLNPLTCVSHFSPHPLITFMVKPLNFTTTRWKFCFFLSHLLSNMVGITHPSID